MTRIIIIITLFICLCKTDSYAQVISLAGPDKTIYLTQGNSTYLNGHESVGTTYQWTKINDIAPPHAEYPYDSSTIVSPTSAVSQLTGLVQGTWYYQLAATTGGTTVKDTCIVRVDYDVPPIGAALIRTFDWTDLASTANLRYDTTGYLGYTVGNYHGDYNLNFERSRLNGATIDSSRGKLYNTIEDGYPWGGNSYGRSELNYPSTEFSIDTNKTYMFEWKGYWPQSIFDNVPHLRPRNASTRAQIISPFQIHGSDPYSPPFAVSVFHDSIAFSEYSGRGNGSSDARKIMSTSDSYIRNITHTIRMTFREGMKYPGQDAFIKVEVDGVQKYYRDTGQVGQTFQADRIKFASLYDWSQSVVDMDSLSRGKKFSVCTEMFNIWELPNTPPPISSTGIKVKGILKTKQE